MEIKSTSLNGILEEEVHVDQPPRYTIKGHEHKVFMLKNAFYSLKQDPRDSYNRIDSYFINNWLNRSKNDPTLYVKTGQQGNIVIVCLYVDDMIYTSNLMLEEFMIVMKNEFEMTDLGLMKYFLGLEVTQTNRAIFIC